jgi:serine/threonine-protein kinase
MHECSFETQRGRLRQLLDDGLPDAEQAELATHLEQCATCCRNLERMAAGSGYWTRLHVLKEDRADEPDACDDESVPLGLFEPAAEAGQLGRLGAYDILRVVGRGGMGIVFQARDRALDRLVAIKILTPGLASTAAARRRFAREARAAAAVVNEHVVSIHAVDITTQGVPYLVMQFVSGKSVQDRIDQEETPRLEEILRIGMQAAQALAAAHAQGLIHRDVKPANILLENGVERVKITDFGLARAVDDATMTQSGVVAGTPRYMAPEQARGDSIDHRADLFSLGSVLYALCTGRPPFLGSSSVATLKSVCEDTPPAINELNPDIPAWLVKIINRLHNKEADDRYASATEVADLLERCLAHVRQPATVPLPDELDEQPSRRLSTARWAIAACVVLCGLSVLASKTAVGEQVVDYVATVLRLKTAEGYLVVETDDPNIAIKVDGDDLIVTGGGVKELRLPVGQHSVQAVKDGAKIKEELVTITRGGRRKLLVRREAAPDAERHTAGRELPALKAPEPELTRRQLELLEKGDNPSPPKVGQNRQLLGIVPRSSEVKAVRFSSDGTKLASCAKDGSICVSRIAPRGVISSWTFQAHENMGPESIAFSPDGDSLATGGADHLVKLWKIGDGSPKEPLFQSNPKQALWAWQGTSIGYRPVAFSPDGTMVALGSLDGIVTVLNATTGREVRRSPRLRRSVSVVRFLPDGTNLAIGLGEVSEVASEIMENQPTRTVGNVQLWHLPNRSIEGTLVGSDGQCRSLAISPDGKTLAAASDDGMMRLYQLSTLSRSGILDCGKDVTGLAFRPDGRVLATSSRKGGVMFWDRATGERRGVLLQADPINGLTFSPDGAILATAGIDGNVRLWDMNEPTAKLPAGDYDGPPRRQTDDRKADAPAIDVPG